MAFFTVWTDAPHPTIDHKTESQHCKVQMDRYNQLYIESMLVVFDHETERARTAMHRIFDANFIRNDEQEAIAKTEIATSFGRTYTERRERYKQALINNTIVVDRRRSL